MAAVGIWLWSDPSKFGQPLNTGCDPTLTVVGVPTHFSSKSLRAVSLMMYSIVLIPGFNLIPPFIFFLTLHISYNWCRRSFWTWRDKTTEQGLPRSSPDSHETTQSSTPHTAFLIVGLVSLVAINILFIVDIELTLRHNKGNQNGKEAAWGFGQVLALLLLIIPLRDASGALQDIRENLRGAQGQFEDLVLRHCQAMPVCSPAGRFLWEIELVQFFGTESSMLDAVVHKYFRLARARLALHATRRTRWPRTQPPARTGLALHATRRKRSPTRARLARTRLAATRRLARTPPPAARTFLARAAGPLRRAADEEEMRAPHLAHRQTAGGGVNSAQVVECLEAADARLRLGERER
ncbi:hypothetical protein GGX14DRAFT_660241 [Mycena pura]|uniref:Uncharacterized protein n=1 Tax=Mycena pura TaxID=153505 RepID=A0AAD6V5D9_9AGAR|nr:hypothetical protein GGX14DRAFT_660241 [Mycena pura]